MTLENVKKLICFIAIFFIGEQMSASEIDDDIPYIRYAKEIMNPFIQDCEKQYHLDCIGTGGRFAKNVGGINIDFIAYRKGSIEEARTLEVKMIETLLTKINTFEKIRPFLAEYPFKSKDINISVAFHKSDNSYYGDGSIVYVSHIKNKLFYRSANPKTDQLVHIFDEPYEEALKIVYKTVPDVKMDVPQDKPKS